LRCWNIGKAQKKNIGILEHRSSGMNRILVKKEPIGEE